MRNLKFSKYPDIHAMKKDVDEYILNNELGIMSTMPDDYFDNIEFRTEGTNKLKYGYKNGFPYYMGSETDVVALQKEALQGRYKTMYPEDGTTLGDFAKGTPEAIANIPIGVGVAIDNVFKLVDNITGGAVTEVDNFLSENFPNTLGKKVEYKIPEGTAATIGSMVGQYVVPGMGVYKMTRGALLLAEPLTVGLFSSKDEGNLANVIEDMFPEFTKSTELSKAIIEGLSVDQDDAEVTARIKNIVADAIPFVVAEKFYKILKALKQNPEAIQELKAVGAAASPTTKPSEPVIMQGDTNLVKTNISEEDFAKSDFDRIEYIEGEDKPFRVYNKNSDSYISFKTQEMAEENINANIKGNKRIEEENALIRSTSEKTFYSNVEKAISNMTMTSGRGDQILATIKNTSGVKQSEIEDLGLDQFLAGKEKVTIEELNDFIADKSLITRVKDTILDNDPDKLSMGESVRTKFGQQDLVTPGGKNYKEMLITVPGTPQVYTKHHYSGVVPSGENLIAHTRFNERVIDGKKTLFIEEIQSDLHQAGRKQGYLSDVKNVEKEAQINLLKKEGDELYNKYKEVQEKSFYSQADAPTFGKATKVDIIDGSNGKIVKTYELTGNQTEQSNIVLRAAAEADDMNIAAGVNDELTTMRTRLNEIENELDTLKESFSVPDAPFKKNWHELTMKRLIKYAIDNGFDAIAFTSGKMQNIRYNLSEKITALRAEKIIGGTKDGQYELTATPKYGEQITQVVPENELERFVGKELSAKIINEAPTYKDGRTYTGLDLEFGGSGMEGFYDNMLPKYLSKFGNKYNAKLEKAELNMASVKEYNPKDITQFNKVYDAIGKNGDVFASYKIVQNFDNVPEKRIEVIQIKNGKEIVIHRDYNLNDAKAVLVDELQGFTVPQIIEKKKSYEVPFMIFTPEMKKEILEQGVPIAQIQDNQQEQQTAVV